MRNRLAPGPKKRQCMPHTAAVHRFQVSELPGLLDEVNSARNHLADERGAGSALARTRSRPEPTCSPPSRCTLPRSSRPAGRSPTAARRVASPASYERFPHHLVMPDLPA